MDKEQVQQAILKKFGSVSEFARVSGYSRYDLQKMFARKHNDIKNLMAVSHLVRSTKRVPSEVMIRPAQLKSLHKALKEAGGVNKFCVENPQFSRISVFQILAGRRQYMTAKVKDLFNHFGI